MEALKTEMESIPQKVSVGWFDRKRGKYCSFREMFVNVGLEFRILRLRIRLAFLMVRFKIRDLLFQFRNRQLERRLASLIRETGSQPLGGKCAEDHSDSRCGIDK